MKDKIIPDSDHVARLCKPTTVEDGEILTSAFLLRPDEESLSVNWLEYFKLASIEREVAEIQIAYNKKFKRVSPNAKIAVMNVGQARNKVLLESEDRRNLTFKHDPLTEDPSHSEIYDMKPDMETIAELILSVVDQEHHIYPAKI